MQYALLIYTDEHVDAQMSEAEQATLYEGYNAFGKEAEQRGVIRGGDALMPTSTATTVRVRNGKMLTTDGPFAETKEQLGGFYILDCKDLDEAIEFAAKIPGAAYGSLEIRPVMVFE